jgi:hypothetical protein
MGNRLWFNVNKVKIIPAYCKVGIILTVVIENYYFGLSVIGYDRKLLILTEKCTQSELVNRRNDVSITMLADIYIANWIFVEGLINDS